MGTSHGFSPGAKAYTRLTSSQVPMLAFRTRPVTSYTEPSAFSFTGLIPVLRRTSIARTTVIP